MNMKSHCAESRTVSLGFSDYPLLLFFSSSLVFFFSSPLSFSFFFLPLSAVGGRIPAHGAISIDLACCHTAASVTSSADDIGRLSGGGRVVDAG